MMFRLFTSCGVSIRPNPNSFLFIYYFFNWVSSSLLFSENYRFTLHNASFFFFFFLFSFVVAVAADGSGELIKTGRVISGQVMKKASHKLRCGIITALVTDDF